jgi:hypothetical protein
MVRCTLQSDVPNAESVEEKSLWEQLRNGIEGEFEFRKILTLDCPVEVLQHAKMSKVSKFSVPPNIHC